MTSPPNLLFALLILLVSHPSFVAAQSENRSKAYVGIERVFPNLRFNRPVYLTGANDGTDRLFVIEQDGVIRVIPKLESEGAQTISDAATFLDLREKISRRGNEEGLLGLAFHPDFKTNRKFYVYYSWLDPDMPKPQRGKPRPVAPSVISEFTVSEENPNRALVESERKILVEPQPFANHNGGMIDFGHDGYLYASFGDGGSANDPLGNGQKLESILGSIIRIDVDRKDEGLAYAIPEDNPFVNDVRARGELWAIGLRNVWRFSFDRKTGELFAADVGQDKIEEVNLIKKGRNYGWNRFEANEVFRANTKLVSGEHEKPIAIYEHSWGLSITGGCVYRGTKYPELSGTYFFGDYVSGNLWGTKRADDGSYETELVRKTGRSIASFGYDDQGEVYLLSFDGGIYRIVSTDEPADELADWPKWLSETGLYASTSQRKVADDLIPYFVNAPFWSDGAEKSRYVKLPKNKTMKYREQGTWEVPTGTTIVKDFHLRNRRGKYPIETRVIKRTDGGWESATYVWNKERNDAELVPEGKQFENWTREGVFSWHAPSSSECASCHTDASGYVLGLSTAQLNREVEGQNQIQRWQTEGYVSVPANLNIDEAPKFCSPDDQDESLEKRARIYLDVNCAMCHRPNGSGNANIDLRYATKLDRTGMVNQPPAQNQMGIENARIVAPGIPERSILVKRIESSSTGRMPSIGSNRVDKKAVELIAEWIKSMPED